MSDTLCALLTTVFFRPASALIITGLPVTSTCVAAETGRAKPAASMAVMETAAMVLLIDLFMMKVSL